MTISITLFSLIILFSIFEAYFRYIYDQPDGLGFLKVNQKWHERHVIFNSHFFRDRDFDPVKKEDVKRIGVLGDSITFGGGIEDVQNRFSNILESKLKQAGYNVEVFNLGKPGHDTEGEIEVYQNPSVKNLNFDILIWQYFLNDIQSVDKSTGTPIIEKNIKKAKIIEFFSNKSYFFDYLYWRITAKHKKTIFELKSADLSIYRDPDKLAIHKKEIADFIVDLKKEEKKIITIIFPSLFFLGPNYPARDIHQIMSTIFSENGVEVIDLLETLENSNPKDVMASRYDAHPNEYVHNLAAQKLFEKVSALLEQSKPF